MKTVPVAGGERGIETTPKPFHPRGAFPFQVSVVGN